MKAWSYTFGAVRSAAEPFGLAFIHPGFVARVLSTLGNGEEFIVTLSKQDNTRSHAQNRALWGPTYDQLIAGLAEKTGVDMHDTLSKEHMHEGLLMCFSGVVRDPVTGREVAKERSSTMTTARFAEFLEWIARYAATEHGVVITLPGEL